MPRWKLLLIPLALLVPACAYVAGALVGEPEAPVQPHSIVLQDDGEEHQPAGDSGDVGDEVEDGGDDDADKERVKVVVPPPAQVDDGDDDDGDDDRDDGDDDRDDDGDDGDDDVDDDD
jgi:hypothetical protein